MIYKNQKLKAAFSPCHRRETCRLSLPIQSVAGNRKLRSVCMNYCLHFVPMFLPYQGKDRRLRLLKVSSGSLVCLSLRLKSLLSWFLRAIPTYRSGTFATKTGLGKKQSWMAAKPSSLEKQERTCFRRSNAVQASDRGINRQNSAYVNSKFHGQVGNNKPEPNSNHNM